MEASPKPSKWLSPRWLKVLIIIVLALGITLRFVNLELKPYWFDEASTSIQLSGYTDAEVVQQMENKILSVADLQKYQYPSPEKNALDTAHGLAIKEPQLSPLYFVLTRFWVQWFGNSLAVTRSASVIFSLLALPCVYWFCVELFKSPLVGWVAIALFSVSPFHVLYAQEARPPSLWGLTILLSHIAFLRALRLKTPVSWLLYSLSIAAGLYTYLFAAFVPFIYGAYILLLARFRSTRTLFAFAASTLLGIMGFMPWVIYALIGNRQSIGGQQGDGSRSAYVLVKGWSNLLGRIFVDFNLNETSPRIYFGSYLVLLLAMIVLMGYAIYHLCRTAQRSVWLFVVLMIAMPVLPLVLPDIVIGGSRSTVARYLVPTCIGVQFAVAYLLATKITEVLTPSKQQQLWKSCFAIVLSLGLVSCVVMVQSELWWNKANSNSERQLATMINRADRPLVVSDAYLVLMLSFSHSLNEKVHTLLLPKSKLPATLDGFDNIFLYMPSPDLVEGLKAKYTLQPIDPPTLWKLQK